MELCFSSTSQSIGKAAKQALGHIRGQALASQALILDAVGTKEVGKPSEDALEASDTDS